MNTTALLEATRKDARKGMLMIAEQLGSLLAENPGLNELAKGLTGHVPTDDRARGIRDALLEVLSSAAATSVTRARRRVRIIEPKPKWAAALEQLSDGAVHQFSDAGVATVDELRDLGLVEDALPFSGTGGGRFVRLSEAGLALVASKVRPSLDDP
jgi:hypothetical protein